MRKLMIGFVCGIIGAIINIIFLLFASDLEKEVYLSTAITWIVIGILISACNFKVNGVIKGMIKGMIVSILVSAPSLVYTFTSSLSGAIWTVVSTIIVGSIIGYAIEKTSKTITDKNQSNSG